MRKIIFLLGITLPCVGLAQLANVLPDRVTADDNGQRKTFIVAADEMAASTDGGKMEVRSGNVSQMLRAKSLSPETRLVLYPEGVSRTVFTRRLLTEKMLVHVALGSDVAQLAAEWGVLKSEPAPGLPDHYIFTTWSSPTALKSVGSLGSYPGVLSAETILARQQKRRAAPNDRFFGMQWYLRNTGQSGGIRGIDAGVVPIWGNFLGAGIRGRGVVIGIVDDGVQFTHPDIRPNYDITLDYDWNDNTHFDPSPSQRNGDFHGTSVAGVAAARGGNKIGVCGVAPNARLTGLRLIADYEDDSQEGSAFLFRSDRISIKNNSWGPNDDGQTMEAPGPIGAQALRDATSTGRGGLGTIFVWASGNGRELGDNSNYDGYANSIYTIAVTAITNWGRATYYAEGGANVLIGAPSDNYPNSGIVTTDLTGSNGYNYKGVRGEISDANYTRTFGGTSSATPVISGVVALMLQANPNLGWRDVQEILIRTARKNDAGNASWITNNAGFHFNQEYGAGLVNGTAAVQMSQSWTNLGPQTEQTVPVSAGAIPDGSGSLVRTFSVPTSQRVEHVTVKTDITHPYRGQLRITLTSPSGTVSELAAKHGDPYPAIEWTYMTVRNWGETSDGVWTLKIEDLTLGKTGTLGSAEVTVFGTDVAAP